MSIFQAIVYGIVQGIAEFLPISSTAHLVLLPWIFGWQDFGVSFDVALHLGTAAAVILFFFKDWLHLIHAGFCAPKSQDGRLFWFIVLATIPGALFGMALNNYMDALRAPVLIGITLILMGIALYLVDRFARRDIDMMQIGAKRSLIIGLSQVLAVIPGVSRSGITMTTGRLLGLKRESIARFTFLMSAPIVLGDGLYHAKDMIGGPLDIAPFVVAMLTSAIVGMLSIRFLLNFLQKRGLGVFAVYRLVLGVFVIALFFLRTQGAA